MMGYQRAVDVPPWFALRVRPRWEKCAGEVLRSKGYDEFVPLYRSRRRWSDRDKEVLVPLFPGYIFCRLLPAAYGKVLSTPGVIEFVGIGKAPSPVDDGEIEAIKTIVNARLQIEQLPFLAAGQRVRIEGGPLYGLEGILLKVGRQHRLVASVTLLQRSVAVEVDLDWVRLITAAGNPAATPLIPSRQIA